MKKILILFFETRLVHSSLFPWYHTDITHHMCFTAVLTCIKNPPQRGHAEESAGLGHIHKSSSLESPVLSTSVGSDSPSWMNSQNQIWQDLNGHTWTKLDRKWSSRRTSLINGEEFPTGSVGLCAWVLLSPRTFWVVDRTVSLHARSNVLYCIVT